MKRRIALVALALAVPVAVAAAVLWNRATPAERAARPILERHAAARGGLEAWRAVRTLSFSGTVDAGVARDPVKLARSFQRTLDAMKADARRAAAHPEPPAKPVQLTFVMELARPRRSRVEVTFQGQTAVQVYDGRRGWKVRPYLGRREVEPFSAEELRVAAQQSELEGPLLAALDHHDRVALVGREKVEGRDAYKLEVTAGGTVRHVWVDAETYLDVKVDGSRRLDGRLRPVFTEQREFRSVNGLLIPHLVETSVEGVRGSEQIHIERVALNPRLAPDRFARPD